MPRKLLLTIALCIAAATAGALYLTRSEKALAVSKAEPGPPGTKVVAYYFHLTARCTTCRTIESYSREVIEQRFARDITKGRLEYKMVNVQLPENRHFVKDYQLFTKSLVLVRFENGKQAEYKVLNDTWELVGDKKAMQAYVEREVRGYLSRLS